MLVSVGEFGPVEQRWRVEGVGEGLSLTQGGAGGLGEGVDPSNGVVGEGVGEAIGGVGDEFVFFAAEVSNDAESNATNGGGDAGMVHVGADELADE